MAQVRYLISEVGKLDGFYLLMISLEKLFKWRVSPSGNRLPKAKKGQKRGLGGHSQTTLTARGEGGLNKCQRY